jgi:hypothetical protein
MYHLANRKLSKFASSVLTLLDKIYQEGLHRRTVDRLP